MAQEWLPPQAPTHPPDSALPRGSGTMPRPPRDRPRRRPLQTAALALGAASVLVTLVSAGTGFLFAAMFAAGGVGFGRRTGHRPAVVLGVIGIALAVVAAITWSILASQGITPQDLQNSLERALESQRR